jgi:type II secretory pathway pseudopilin PulG
METNPYQSTLHVSEPTVPRSLPWRPTLLGCLAVIGIVGVVVALLLPNVRRSRESVRHMQCSNNLKQIAVALHSYHDAYGVLPPAHTVDADGKPLHSWRTLILPFMGYEPIYDKIDLSKPWDDPANKEVFDLSVPGYSCPSATSTPIETTYMAVAVPGGCFRPTEPRKFAEITDDHNWTLMVMEVDANQAVHWMSPTDSLDLAFLDQKTGANLSHFRGIHAAFVTGQVRYLRAGLKPETLRALITIDGKDDPAAKNAN